jgi:hypothetical protein
MLKGGDGSFYKSARVFLRIKCTQGEINFPSGIDGEIGEGG